MFRRKTAFIVGAGASAEYRLPVGSQLSANIARTLDEIHKLNHDVQYDRAIVHGFQQINGGYRQDDLTKIRQFQNGLLHASSIDRFLNVHAADQYIQKLGKFGVVHAILKAEADSTLQVGKSNELNMAGIRAHASLNWLGELFINMQEDTHREQIEEIFSNLSFICFNYDRCIEHFMFHAVREFAMADDGFAAAALQHLRIYHPYGRIGRLPWEKGGRENAVRFGDVENFPQVVQASASNIRTFAEEQHDAELREGINKALREAEQLVFLGFSFLDQNMALLTSNFPVRPGALYATTFGESDANLGIVRTLVQRLRTGHGGSDAGAARLVEYSGRAGEFIHAYGRQLRSA